MKLVLNNYPEWLVSEEPTKQELPGDTLIEYYNDRGDRFRISPSESGQGLSITMYRNAGFNMMAIHPRFSNSIEIE